MPVQVGWHISAVWNFMLQTNLQNKNALAVADFQASAIEGDSQKTSQKQKQKCAEMLKAKSQSEMSCPRTTQVLREHLHPARLEPAFPHEPTPTSFAGETLLPSTSVWLKLEKGAEIVLIICRSTIMSLCSG